MDPLDAGAFFFGDRTFGGSANVVGAIFLGFLAGGLAALIAFMRDADMSLGALTGVRFEQRPALLGAAWEGAKRTLLIGVVGMALFFYVALIIDLAAADFGPEGRDVLASAIAFIPWLLGWGLLDFGGVMLLNAMRFFISEPDVLLTGRPGWIYLSVLVAVAAFLLGGLAAARARRADHPAGALQASVSPVLIIMPVLFVASWFWASSDGGEIVGSAVLLPLLWSVVLAAGGVVWLNQVGMAPGITVRTASTPAQREGRFCAQCGNALDAAARFCSNCGAPAPT